MASKYIIDICGVVMKKSETAATAPTNPHHGLSFFKPKIKSGKGAKYKKRNAKKMAKSSADPNNRIGMSSRFHRRSKQREDLVL